MTSNRQLIEQAVRKTIAVAAERCNSLAMRHRAERDQAKFDACSACDFAIGGIDVEAIVVDVLAPRILPDDRRRKCGGAVVDGLCDAAQDGECEDPRR